MKLLVIFALAFTAFATTAKAELQNCTISVKKVALTSFVSDENPEVKIFGEQSAKDCFKRAIKMADGLALQGVDSVQTYASVHPDENRYEQIAWRMAVSWNYNDGYLFDSKGEVTSYTAQCLNNKMPVAFTGNLRFWTNCERF